MLHEFITTNRDEILLRTRARVSARTSPQPTNEELLQGIPLFLDELVRLLINKFGSTDPIDNDASRHGSLGFELGLTVGQVVHDYGDVCQVLTGLAIEKRAEVSTEDFRALNLCLDDAIACAVTDHARASHAALADLNTERFGQLAHELRNNLASAVLSFEILKTGSVPISGSTGAVLGRSLAALSDVIDRSLTEVRLEAGIVHTRPIDVCAFLGEIEMTGRIAASASRSSLLVQLGDRHVCVAGDRQLLSSAVMNLLQNAFKFTPAGGRVVLRTSATAQRVKLEIADECGGISEHVIDALFTPFAQGSDDRRGLGLGLVISKRAIESMKGELQVRNVPGHGCVFTIDLLRCASQA